MEEAARRQGTLPGGISLYTSPDSAMPVAVQSRISSTVVCSRAAFQSTPDHSRHCIAAARNYNRHSYFRTLDSNLACRVGLLHRVRCYLFVFIGRCLYPFE